MENKQKMHIPPYLIDQLRQQDESAIRQLYLIIAPFIKAFVLNNKGTEEDAEDVVHDVIIKIIKILVEGKYEESGKFEAFVWRIVRNTWFEELRKRKKMTTDSPDDYHNIGDEDSKKNTFENQNSQNYILSILHKAILKLDIPCQIILEQWSRDIKGEEIAEKMGLEHGAIRTRINRCKTRLREEFMRLLGRNGDDYIDYLWNEEDI